MRKDILIIGDGKIGAEYSRILSAMNISHSILGRMSKNELKRSISRSGKKTHYILTTPPGPMAGIYNLLRECTNPEIPILAEKPFTYDSNFLNSIKDIDKKLFIALNRRFLSSTERIIRLSRNSNIKSLHFDFSEQVINWNNTLGQNNHLDFKNAILYQSVHVIDLAFFLMGRPQETKFFKKGSFNKFGGGIVSGCGVSEKGTLFTFQANWSSPGNWRIDLGTDNKRFILDPLEDLLIFEYKDAIDKEAKYKKKFLFSNEIDKEYKPGFFKQTKLFVNNKFDQLVDLYSYSQTQKWINELIVE